jgi:hypothetical protein
MILRQALVWLASMMILHRLSGRQRTVAQKKVAHIRLEELAWPATTLCRHVNIEWSLSTL